MFTGIIRNQGKVVPSLKNWAELGQPTETLLTISTALTPQLHEGDSVAVNGVCLTVLEKYGNKAWVARLMQETLDKTTLKNVQPGDLLNLELPVASGERMHGHIVQGHVDGVATITAITPVGDDRVFTVTPPIDLLKNISKKGSIALDGVSLTVVNVLEDSFTVSLMPYTLAHTTLGNYHVGDMVNIETDKHVRALWHTGVVQKGDGRGTALGFPTANIVLDDQSTIEEGIFAVRAMIAGDPTIYAGALHAGPRPTFPDATPSVEIHLINFPARDLYGENISFSVIEKIRDVQKFESEQGLIAAINSDVQRTTKILSKVE